MLRHTLAAVIVGATLFGATAAQAGTHWSIGINLPPAGVYVSNAPRNYAPEPAQVYYAPEPAPVYYAPEPVVYAPRYVEREVYYAPAPRVVYETSYRDRRWDGRGDRWDGRHGHDRYEHHDRHDRWDGDRDYGPRRGR